MLCIAYCNNHYPSVYNLALSSKRFFGDLPAPTVIEKGTRCEVDGLQSETGKKLNGRKGIVIRYVKKDMRYELRMEEDDDNNDSGNKQTTYALKGTNLIPLPPKLGASNKHLASTLLNESLRVSLGRVLQHSKSGITLESALSLSDLPEGSAVIAGSTIVQACLGELWGGCGGCDVDVFCTAKDAPKVRSVSTLFHIDLG